MRFDKYTVKAQESVMRAQELAQRMDHPELTPLHLLGALLQETEGVVRPLLQKLVPLTSHRQKQPRRDARHRPPSLALRQRPRSVLANRWRSLLLLV